MNLRIHRLAVVEIDREVDYYESRQVGLGMELEDEIDAAFSLIVRFPEAAPQWRNRKDRRVAVLDRFPSLFPINLRARTSWSSRSHTQAVGRTIGRGAASVLSGELPDRAYWRQVLTAILRANDRLLIARAVIIGWIGGWMATRSKRGPSLVQG